MYTEGVFLFLGAGEAKKATKSSQSGIQWRPASGVFGSQLGRCDLHRFYSAIWKDKDFPQFFFTMLNSIFENNYSIAFIQINTESDYQQPLKFRMQFEHTVELSFHPLHRAKRSVHTITRHQTWNNKTRTRPPCKKHPRGRTFWPPTTHF